MATVTNAILQNLLATIRATGIFADVALGEFPPGAAVPRASLLLLEQKPFPSDDSTSQWFELSMQATLHTRAESHAQGIDRLVSLFHSLRSAVLTDPYRNGLCCDLPIGLATEVGSFQPDKTVREPERRATVVIRCHFEV